MVETVHDVAQLPSARSLHIAMISLRHVHVHRKRSLKGLADISRGRSVHHMTLNDTPAAGGFWQVGADIGGTFTDVIALDAHARVVATKVLSTPPHFHRGVIDGVTAALSEADAEPATVDTLLHATTVATNAILERDGAPTALVTTRGFRDVLELGRLRRPYLYDLSWQKPEPLARRRHRFELDHRIAGNGEILRPVSTAEVRRIAESAEREGIRAIAVCLLNSFLRPDVRAGRGGATAGGASRGVCDRVGRRLTRHARVRTHQHRHGQRLRRAGRTRLRRRAARRAARPGHQGAAAHHAVHRWAPGRRDGGRAAGADHRIGSGGRRRRRPEARTAYEPGQRGRLRHGWHDSQGLLDRGRRAVRGGGLRGRRRDERESRARQGSRLHRPRALDRYR